MQLTKLQFKNLLSFEDITVDLVDNEEKNPKVSGFNLFIGPNNEGKSNILKGIQFAHAVVKALSAYCNKFFNPGNLNDLHWKIESFEEITKVDLTFLREEQDLFFGQDLKKEISFCIGFMLDEEKLDRFFPIISDLEYYDPENPFKYIGENIFEISGALKKENDGYFIDMKMISFPYSKNESADDKAGINKRIQSSSIPQFFIDFFSKVFSNINHKRCASLLKVLFSEMEEIFSERLKVIQSFRKIGEFNYAKEDSRGETGETAKALSKLRDGMHAERKRFMEIKKFIRELVFPDIDIERIEIIFPRQEDGSFFLKLNVDDRILPLSQLGSGIEQLTYLAVEILMADDQSVFLIEEPETGFHPKLQRAFIRFLQEDLKDKDHQFFITTHSSVFIDPFLQHEDSKVFKVGIKKENNSSHVEDLGDLIQYSKLFYEMGTKGADYLLANGIIWVEGPSDRIYILKWLEIYFELEKKKDKPKEGRDYSFLFYGGSILSSFEVGKEVDDQEIKKEGEEFINLIKISQNIAVIMDRDSTTNKKWKTKKKIEKEISCFPSGYSWITDGKEIENYLTKENIERAYGKGIWEKEFEKNSKEPLKEYLKEERISILSKKKEFALKVTEKMELQDLKENRELCEKIAGYCQ